MRIKKSKHTILRVLIVLSFVAHIGRFNSLDPIGGFDWPFLYDGYLRTLLEELHVRRTSRGTGYVFNTIPHHTIRAITAYASGFLPYVVIERVLYFGCMTFVAPISIYYLLNKTLENRVNRDRGVCLGSIIFLFSNALFIEQAGNINFAVSYSFFPGLLWALMSYFETGKMRFYLWSLLITVCINSYDIRVIYFVFIFIGLYLLFYRNKRTLGRIFLYGLGVILISAYWLLPFILVQGDGGSFGFLGRALFGGQYIDIVHALSFSHPFFGINGMTIFEKNTILFSSMLLLLVVVLGFIGYRISEWNRVHKLFFLYRLLGVFLIKLEGRPLVGAYAFLYDVLPGFSLFRESLKFFLISGVSYSVLIGRLITGTKSNAYRMCLMGSVGLFVISNIWFFFSGGYLGLHSTKKIAESHIAVMNHLGEDEKYGRVLRIPRRPGEAFYSTEKPALSMRDMMEFSGLGCKDIGQKFMRYSENDLSIMIRKYAISHIVASSGYNEMCASKEELGEFLDSQSSLLHNDFAADGIGENDLIVYSTLPETDLFEFDNGTGTYKRLSSVSYEIRASFIDEGSIIFKETYSSGRKLCEQGGRCFDHTHTIYAGYGNKWLIDSIGTGEKVWTLEFTPNKYLNIGKYITVIFCFVLLLVGRLFKKEKNKK